MLSIRDPFEMPTNIPVFAPRNKRIYELVGPYVLLFDMDGETWQLTIPDRYRCDGASIPRLLWTFSDLTPDGLIRPAALVHDFLYEFRGKLPLASLKRYNKETKTFNFHHRTFSRKDADNIFKAIMRKAGVSETSRDMAYRAVRWFGWWAWRT